MESSHKRPLWVPSATVFVSSAFIMIIEIVASRLIAKDLGSSLYTWTAVIGIVLAGITIGNFVGGLIADRFPVRKSLSLIFALSSIGCVCILVVNHAVGPWLWRFELSLPARVFTHVSIVFLFPSSLLGMISPVAAKMALDQHQAQGRTVGTIYAWGAAGSIVGTFLAGFYLIAVLGITTIIWGVAAGLLIMAMLYGVRFRPLHVWLCLFVGLLVLSHLSTPWAMKASAALCLTPFTEPGVLYKKDTQYCHVAVVQASEDPDIRMFIQDNGEHSRANLDDIQDLQLLYPKIFAAVTTHFKSPEKRLNVFSIGGGGYVFPRYLEAIWPDSQIDVAEIDPQVTEAAILAFGLSPHTKIKSRNMDGRNFLDTMHKRSAEARIAQYDFIYGDAFNGFAIPFQLVTKEVHDKIAGLLTDDGIYVLNVVDIYDLGNFTGTMIHTLEQTFPFVEVVTARHSTSHLQNFIILAAKNPMDLRRLDQEEQVCGLNLWILTEAEKNELKTKAGQLIFTDNYAPVDHLIIPLVRKRSKEIMMSRYLKEASQLQQQGNWQKAIQYYQQAKKKSPQMILSITPRMVRIYLSQGQPEKAIAVAKEAIASDVVRKGYGSAASIRLLLARAYHLQGDHRQSREQLEKILVEYQAVLGKNPDVVVYLLRTGQTLTVLERYQEADNLYRRAIKHRPDKVEGYLSLAGSLRSQKKPANAIEVLREGKSQMVAFNKPKGLQKIETLLEKLKATSGAK